MEKNLDITNPPFNEQIWPVPSDVPLYVNTANLGGRTVHSYINYFCICTVRDVCKIENYIEITVFSTTVCLLQLPTLFRSNCCFQRENDETLLFILIVNKAIMTTGLNNTNNIHRLLRGNQIWIFKF